MEIELNRHLLVVVVCLGALTVLMFFGIWILRGYGLSEFRPKSRRAAAPSHDEAAPRGPTESDGQ